MAASAMLRSLSSPAERVEDRVVVLEVGRGERLAHLGDGQFDLTRPQVGDRRDLGDRDGLLGEPLDVLELATFAWLGERDRRSLATGATDATDPVDVALCR